MDDDEESSLAPAAFRLRSDVFLSYRSGEDECESFAETLSYTLEISGIRVFHNDDESLNSDENKSGELLGAIEDSAASIVIITANYAESWWRLEELAKIREFQRLILPVFFKVDPSHVRHQNGPFEEAFKSHENRFGKDRVESWRRAMAKSGQIAGCIFKNSHEKAELTHNLVERVVTELSNTPMFVASLVVGLDSRIEHVMRLLNVKDNSTKVLGLYGMGGIGKTTLAKALFNKLCGYFKHRSFISDVRENSTKNDGLVSLQNKLIRDLLPAKQPVEEVNAGIDEIKRMASIHQKPILVVLDDVNDVSQLDALCGGREWFYEGSRIIITTRDREVLANHIVNELYEVEALTLPQALQLFSYHALKRETPTEKYLSLCQQIVSITGRLPLALEVFGSHLCDKRKIEEWEDAVRKLKSVRPSSLHDVLKLSFDALKEEEQCVFLDISCLFVKKGMKRADAIDVWKGCGFKAEQAVIILVAKSLIKITEEDTLSMHDQIRDMGRQIVRSKDLRDPSLHSRLWNHEEIMSILENNMGTEWIEGIILESGKKKLVRDPSGGRISWDNLRRKPNLSNALAYLKERFKEDIEDQEEVKVTICTKEFETMVNLRLLQINCVHLKGDMKFLPANLRWLQWRGCPLRTLPSDLFHLHTAVLDLSESKIKKLRGPNSSCFGLYDKVNKNLMVMNLRGCYDLTALPDLCKLQNLEKLILEGCKRLNKIHQSIGKVNALLHLNLKGCSDLIELPSSVCRLKMLENLNLSGCSKIKKLPKNIGSISSLKNLQLSATAIRNLPESVCLLKNLIKLALSKCKVLKRLPQGIGDLSSLIELFLDGSGVEVIPESVGSLVNLEKVRLSWCASLTAIPNSIANLVSLKELLTYGSAIEELPGSVGSLMNLKLLSIGKGHYLQRLPDSIGELVSINELSIEGTSIMQLPEKIGELKTLKKLEMLRCKSLRSLPEATGGMLALTTLIIYEADIEVLPESIEKLKNLILLRLNKCKRLHTLPTSMGNLKSLHHLYMEETAVTRLPESFGKLSNLMVLKMAKKQLTYSGTYEATSTSVHDENKDVLLPTSFPDLHSLKELDARNWKITGTISNDFEKLSSLETLNLGRNHISGLPSSLRGLIYLQKLYLPHCMELKSLPPLPSALLELDVANCTSLENISDISNLTSLQLLNLTNCDKVVDVPGLECLKSLIRLYLGSCNKCSSVVRKRLSKISLRNIRNLSMPGSQIPDWFSQESVKFLSHKNCDIKGVIIAAIVSLNHEDQNSSIQDPPTIVDIQASVLKLDLAIHTTTLYLLGKPNSSEDHIHLCRFPTCTPLVASLKDGYKIQVAKRNPPFLKGVELKKYGIHFVYEGDDDYGGDEESLNESQQSLSERLAKFFNTQ